MFRFAALDRLAELCPPALHHFACQSGRGREALDRQAVTRCLWSPADCEISHIVKSHHEKAKPSLILEDLGNPLRFESPSKPNSRTVRRTKRRKRPHKHSTASDSRSGASEQTRHLNHSRTDSSGRQQNLRLRPDRFFRQRKCGGAGQLLPEGSWEPL